MGAVNPCDDADAVCQNGGTCELVVNKSTLSAHSQCSCQIGFSGQYCEKYICTDKSCLNGVCFPLSSSTYTCDCYDGWSGDKCDTYVCANVECNQGRCEALSEIETRCVCDSGWHGQFCDISTNPCEYMPCKHGVCEVMSLTEAQCVCNSIFWIGKYCDIWMFTPRL
nr:delta-like protein 4 [Crassostrea gigas]